MECTKASLRTAGPNLLVPGTGFMEDNFSTEPAAVPEGSVSGWFNCIAFKHTSCCAARSLPAPDRYQSTARRSGTPSEITFGFQYVYGLLVVTQSTSSHKRSWNGLLHSAQDSEQFQTQRNQPFAPHLPVCHLPCSLFIQRYILCHSLRWLKTEIALTYQNLCSLHFDLIILLKQINNAVTLGDHLFISVSPSLSKSFTAKFVVNYWELTPSPHLLTRSSVREQRCPSLIGFTI